jgi:hypothetical protein
VLELGCTRAGAEIAAWGKVDGALDRLVSYSGEPVVNQPTEW